MLELDLDLEADLGVDTVKQAETFAAVREAFAIPRVENLKLRDFPTLRHVVGFVHQHRPDLAAAATAASPVLATSAQPEVPAAPAIVAQSFEAVPPAPTQVTPVASPPTPRTATDPVTARVLAIVAEKTGYPTEMLELDLDLEADLGVDTVKQAETFASVREAYGIARQEGLKLRDFPTLRHVVGFVFDHRPDLAPPVAAQTGDGAAASEPATPGAADTPRAPAPAPAATAFALAGAAALADADRIPRRVATPALRPPLAFCKSTGVSLGSGSRILVAFDENGVGIRDGGPARAARGHRVVAPARPRSRGVRPAREDVARGGRSTGCTGCPRSTSSPRWRHSTSMSSACSWASASSGWRT